MGHDDRGGGGRMDTLREAARQHPVYPIRQDNVAEPNLCKPGRFDSCK